MVVMLFILLTPNFTESDFLSPYIFTIKLFQTNVVQLNEIYIVFPGISYVTPCFRKMMKRDLIFVRCIGYIGPDANKNVFTGKTFGSDKLAQHRNSVLTI